MNKLTTTLVGSALALVLFFAVNLLAKSTLSMRLDLTEEKLYTLSEGSLHITEGLEEPVRLYLYVSEHLGDEVASLSTYITRVKEMLREYENTSKGKIVLEIVDPEPFSEDEDRAAAEGLFPAQLASGDPFYFGLVGTNSTGDTQTIKFFDPSKERFLEYDVSSLIHSLANPERAVVGIYSYLDIQGGGFDPRSQRPSPSWQIVNQLNTFFETRFLDPADDAVPEDVDVLMIVHPRDFPPSALYAIDQFVLGGGKALVFVDPHCEVDPTGNDPSNPMAGIGQSKASNPSQLLAAWGLRLVENKFVGDRVNAARVQVPTQGGGARGVDYVAWLNLTADALDDEDPTTSLLNSILMAAAGSLEPLPEAPTEFHPLIESSDESMLMDVGMVQFRPDPETMLASFIPDYERLTLAARVSGNVSTAFPDGNPTASSEDEDDHEHAEGEEHEHEDEEEEQVNEAAHLTSSVAPINVIVVADVDMLDDRFWIREERLFGQISLGYRKTADNGDFTINALENMAGGDDLISIRAQGKFSRPFTVVEEIRREAEQHYLQEEKETERRLQEAQQRFDELQREKSPDDTLILSPEQEAERERAREEVKSLRKSLRNVQHNLNKDIESLGNRIAFYNIAVVPLLVIFSAIGVAVWRALRRSA